jgi:hypothetical protein
MHNKRLELTALRAAIQSFSFAEGKIMESSKEIIGRIIMLICTVLSFYISWWAPLVAAPLIWKIYNVSFCFTDRIYDRKTHLILDIVTHATYWAYLVLAITQFTLNGGRWYLGLVVWFVVAQLFGLLWPRRWHYEKIEGHL